MEENTSAVGEAQTQNKHRHADFIPSQHCFISFNINVLRHV
jgi:hypothetical protein